jgi:23S rRNA (guanosine2251-2'-O)-methyltransferase
MTEDILVGGWHSVLMALERNPHLCREIWLLSNENKSSFIEREAVIATAGLRPQFVDRKTLTKIYGGDGHHGVVLKRKLPNLTPLKEFLNNLGDKKRKNPLILVLDRIQDPGNFGACLRVAACAGADAVIYPNNNSAQITSTVAQAASGALDVLKLVRVPNVANALRELSKIGVWLIGSAEEGDRSLYDVDFSLSTAIIVGNEGSGIRELTRNLCDIVVSLPSGGGVSSLNVSNAATVLIYEALRQRISLSEMS